MKALKLLNISAIINNLDKVNIAIYYMDKSILLGTKTLVESMSL